MGGERGHKQRAFYQTHTARSSAVHVVTYVVGEVTIPSLSRAGYHLPARRRWRASFSRRIRSRLSASSG